MDGVGGELNSMFVGLLEELNTKTKKSNKCLLTTIKRVNRTGVWQNKKNLSSTFSYHTNLSIFHCVHFFPISSSYSTSFFCPWIMNWKLELRFSLNIGHLSFFAVRLLQRFFSVFSTFPLNWDAHFSMFGPTHWSWLDFLLSFNSHLWLHFVWLVFLRDFSRFNLVVSKFSCKVNFSNNFLCGIFLSDFVLRIVTNFNSLTPLWC